MKDKYEGQRWANRARGLWAIILLFIIFITYVEVGNFKYKWLFIFIALIIALIAVLFIWLITKKE